MKPTGHIPNARPSSRIPSPPPPIGLTHEQACSVDEEWQLIDAKTDAEREAIRLRYILLRMKPHIMRQGALWDLLQEALGEEAR